MESIPPPPGRGGVGLLVQESAEVAVSPVTLRGSPFVLTLALLESCKHRKLEQETQGETETFDGSRQRQGVVAAQRQRDQRWGTLARVPPANIGESLVLMRHACCMTLPSEWLTLPRGCGTGRWCNASASVRLWVPDRFLSQLLVMDQDIGCHPGEGSGYCYSGEGSGGC